MRRCRPKIAAGSWPPRSCGRCTSRRCSASSGAATTCSRARARVPRPRQALIALRQWLWPAVNALRRRRHRRRVRRPERGGPSDAATAPACSCSKRARRLGGRATAFPDRETGELVDNGQHVLLGCYTETFAFLRRHRRRRSRPAAAAAGGDDDRSRGAGGRGCVSRAAGAVASAGRHHRLGRAVVARSPVGAADGGAAAERAPGAAAGRDA